MRCVANWHSCSRPRRCSPRRPQRCRLDLGQLVAGRPRRAELFGGQNDARYAIFPSTNRLAIQINGVHKGFRHRRAPDQRRATAAGRWLRVGELHQPVRYVRRVEPARTRHGEGGRDSCRRTRTAAPVRAAPQPHRSRRHRSPHPVRPGIPRPSSRPSRRWPGCISAASSPTRSSPPRRPSFSAGSEGPLRLTCLLLLPMRARANAGSRLL